MTSKEIFRSALALTDRRRGAIYAAKHVEGQRDRLNKAVGAGTIGLQTADQIGRELEAAHDSLGAATVIADEALGDLTREAAGPAAEGDVDAISAIGLYRYGRHPITGAEMTRIQKDAREVRAAMEMEAAGGDDR